MAPDMVDHSHPSHLVRNLANSACSKGSSSCVTKFWVSYLCLDRSCQSKLHQNNSPSHDLHHLQYRLSQCRSLHISIACLFVKGLYLNAFKFFRQPQLPAQNILQDSYTCSYQTQEWFAGPENTRQEFWMKLDPNEIWMVLQL